MAEHGQIFKLLNMTRTETTNTKVSNGMKIGYQLVQVDEMLTECNAVFTTEDDNTLYGYSFYTRESGKMQFFGVDPTIDPEQLKQMFIETKALITI